MRLNLASPRSGLLKKSTPSTRTDQVPFTPSIHHHQLFRENSTLGTAFLILRLMLSHASIVCEASASSSQWALMIMACPLNDWSNEPSTAKLSIWSEQRSSRTVRNRFNRRKIVLRPSGGV